MATPRKLWETNVGLRPATHIMSTFVCLAIPLRVIQEISGHRSLDVLQGYLEVQPHHLHQAIRQLDFPNYESSSVRNSGFKTCRQQRLPQPSRCSNSSRAEMSIIASAISPSWSNDSCASLVFRSSGTLPNLRAICLVITFLNTKQPL